MICKSHERQLSFWGASCGKTGKNPEKQRTNSEGQRLLLKKCAVYSFGDAMQRSGQPGAFPTGLFVFYDAVSVGYRPCLQDTTPP